MGPLSGAGGDIASTIYMNNVLTTSLNTWPTQDRWVDDLVPCRPHQIRRPSFRVVDEVEAP